MQTTDPLQHEIHRRKVRDKQIEVDIERLLGHLGSDHDATLSVTVDGSEGLTEPVVVAQPVERDEARVTQRDRSTPGLPSLR